MDQPDVLRRAIDNFVVAVEIQRLVPLGAVDRSLETTETGSMPKAEGAISETYRSQ
jgi:hypothetical protein